MTALQPTQPSQDGEAQPVQLNQPSSHNSFHNSSHNSFQDSHQLDHQLDHQDRRKEMLAQHEARLFNSLSVSYEQPLIIERGLGHFLLDEHNIAYLDMVNNVCHVGHCHPYVVAAGQAQMAKLNTNTRYLYANILSYSEALLATFPEPLSVVMLVNSGSEANELALRLMRCKTGSDELLVVDGAYHGNTNKAVEISPYKFNGPGGEGAAEHIHIVPMPNP